MIKSIKFEIEMEGQGIVNYDSNDQKYVPTKDRKYSRHNNEMFSKKNFYRNEEGEVFGKVKISSDCIKKSIFNDQADIPNISHNKNILNSYISHPNRILRGYLLTDRKETIKRKGALNITDAEQICDARVYMETFSKHQAKTSYKEHNEETGEDKSDNTFYKKETVGDIKYKASGNIDLSILQFVPCDQILDRYSFNPDTFETYKKFLSRYFPNENSLELKKYIYKSNPFIPELGLKLSDESVIKMVKKFLKNLFATEITRSSSFAKVSKLRIQLIEDPITDNIEGRNYIEINSKEDIDNLEFQIEEFYREASEEEIEKFAIQLETEE